MLETVDNFLIGGFCCGKVSVFEKRVENFQQQKCIKQIFFKSRYTKLRTTSIKMQGADQLQQFEKADIEEMGNLQINAKMYRAISFLC